MIKLIIVVVALFSVSCATTKRPLASHSYIVDKTKRELAERESWNHDPHIVARKVPHGTGERWLVLVDVLDTPNSKLFNPNYARKILYSETGRLISYKRN